LPITTPITWASWWWYAGRWGRGATDTSPFAFATVYPAGAVHRDRHRSFGNGAFFACVITRAVYVFTQATVPVVCENGWSKGRIMPRTAATLCGLVLVALCIGLNTVRYPIVRQMLASTAVASVSDPSSSPATDQPAPAADSPPSRVPSETAPSSSAAAAVKPVPEVAQGSDGERATSTSGANDGTVSAETKTPIPDPPSGDAESAGRSLKPERPLVPVPAIPVPGGAALGVDPAALVRRLPPVDANQPVPAGSMGASSPDGTIPVYPTTGIR
jgi:hypothetical protein